jgi:hypothetical protein
LRRHRFSAPRVTRGEIRDQQQYCRKTMAVHCRLTPFAMAQSSRHPSRAGQARRVASRLQVRPPVTIDSFGLP